jgi:hypothetical protein
MLRDVIGGPPQGLQQEGLDVMSMVGVNEAQRIAAKNESTVSCLNNNSSIPVTVMVPDATLRAGRSTF